jgi:hypothetical protein
MDDGKVVARGNLRQGEGMQRFAGAFANARPLLNQPCWNFLNRFGDFRLLDGRPKRAVRLIGS